MPLFLYLPMIVWMGMVDAARTDMRPMPAKAPRSVKPGPAPLH